MKVIIAGSQGITDYFTVLKAIHDSGFSPILEVVSGGAEGVDALGERFAKACNIPIKPFPAAWKTFGKKAGPIRNSAMAEYADALIAVWDGSSKGTRDMISKATKRKLKIYVHRAG